MKEDLVKVVLNFEESEKWAKGLNASFIALIPKVNNHTNLNEYMPISLVSCIYKIVAKILSRRLKGVLQKVIDSRKTTFLEGRGLMDSVFITNETLEEVKRKRIKCLYLELSYEKAYGSVR